MTALCRSTSLFIAGAIVLGVLGASVLPAAEREDNAWRYRCCNGQWWYWMPEGRWVYWHDNHWNDFTPAAGADSGYARTQSNTPGTGTVLNSSHRGSGEAQPYTTNYGSDATPANGGYTSVEALRPSADTAPTSLDTHQCASRGDQSLTAVAPQHRIGRVQDDSARYGDSDMTVTPLHLIGRVHRDSARYGDSDMDSGPVFSNVSSEGPPRGYGAD